MQDGLFEVAKKSEASGDEKVRVPISHRALDFAQRAWRPFASVLAVALMQTPHRFRTKRQLWAYSGLALETRISAEYRVVEGQVRRSKKLLSIRGLNKDHNHDLKGLFKGAATMASVRPGPFQDFYQAALAKGIKPTMARLTLARKMAAITLTLWKKGENFDAEKLKSQAA